MFLVAVFLNAVEIIPPLNPSACISRKLSGEQGRQPEFEQQPCSRSCDKYIQVTPSCGFSLPSFPRRVASCELPRQFFSLVSFWLRV